MKDEVLQAIKSRDAKILRLEGALAEALISLRAIGETQPPMPPPDATVCIVIAKGALVRIHNRLNNYGGRFS